MQPLGSWPALCVGWRVQVTRGVMYTREEAEGKRLRHPFDTITGGCWCQHVVWPGQTGWTVGCEFRAHQQTGLLAGHPCLPTVR